MEKGKLGVSLYAIAVVAFIVAYIGGLLPTLIMVGFVLMVEKNEWLSKQVMKAFYLTLSYTVVTVILREILGLGTTVFYKIPFIGQVVGGIFGAAQSVFFAILSIAYIFITAFAIFKVSKGGNVVIPIIDKLVQCTFGEQDKK